MPRSGGVYLQLYERLRDDITRGAYPFGARFPSKRTMAEESGVSIMTVEHAYSILCDEGYLVSRERSGYFVAYRDTDLLSVPEEAAPALLPLSVPERSESLPYALYARTIRRILTQWGTRLMEKVLSVLQTKAIKQIFLGMDFNNFFSGIPAPDERKAAFFEKFGFVVSAGEHYDLEADIIHNAFIDSFDDSAFAAEYPVHLFHGEREKVLDFLHREFPGRWEYEFSEALQEKKDFDEIVVLWNRDETEVAGYAMLHAERDAEGKKTGYGGLGPIGIAEKIRGHHVGDYILHEGLLQLRKIGVETVNIDWTILKDFYGQFGFEPARIYRAGVIQKA